MSDEVTADPAAILGAACSLRKRAEELAAANRNNLSSAYQGGDEFMRQCMRVACDFEKWACVHVNFEELSDPWPYLLEDKFGDAAIAAAGSECDLMNLSETDWPAIAEKIGLTLAESIEGPRIK